MTQRRTAAPQSTLERLPSSQRGRGIRADVPHPALLAALGEAEYQTGQNVEAAQHLYAFLALPGNASPKQRETAQRSLQGVLLRMPPS